MFETVRFVCNVSFQWYLITNLNKPCTTGNMSKTSTTQNYNYYGTNINKLERSSDTTSYAPREMNQSLLPYEKHFWRTGHLPSTMESIVSLGHKHSRPIKTEEPTPGQMPHLDRNDDELTNQ